MRRVPLFLFTLTILSTGACTSLVGSPDPAERVKRPAPATAEVSIAEAETTTTQDHEYLYEVLESRVTDSTLSTATSETTAPAPTSSGTKPKSTTTTTAPKPGGSYSSQMEGQFQASINNWRGSNGLAALGRNGSLDAYARSWAKTIAASGSLSHSNIGSLLGPWSTAGENVGFGGTVNQIFNALVASPGHNANMLNGSFTALGVGVYVDGAGTIWTAHIFAG